MENIEKIYDFALNTLRPSLLQRDRDMEFDKAQWKQLASFDLFRGHCPEQLGGLGLSLRELNNLLRELGRGSLDIPLGVSSIAQIIAIDLLVRFGNDFQKNKFLGALVSGDMVAAVCNSEAGAGTDIKSIKSTLTVLDSTQAILETDKRGSTNLSHADVLLCSAWRQETGTKPTLEVVIVDGKESEQRSHVSGLAGFKTGLTGSVVIKNRIVDLNEAQLGGKHGGFAILKHCFNMERLLIASLVTGVLEGLIGDAVLFMSRRNSGGRPLADHQYMQEKIISMYAVKTKLQSIINDITGLQPKTGAADLSTHTKSLAILKMMTIDDVFQALNSYYEVFGFPAYTLENHAQKILRDQMALRFLGGTREQQKILLFNELFNEILAKEQMRSDLEKLFQSQPKAGAGSENQSTQISG